MTQKHPKRKTPISPLSAKELQATLKGIDSDVLGDSIAKLKHDVAP